jgi:hypothetical protein
MYLDYVLQVSQNPFKQILNQVMYSNYAIIELLSVLLDHS